MFNDKTDHEARNHRYSISGMGVDKEPLGVFSINEHSGIVSALRPIDREKYDLFHVSQYWITDPSDDKYTSYRLLIIINNFTRVPLPTDQV